MTKQDPHVFAAYKPLRNFTRRLSYEDICYVVWAFINRFQLNTSLPSDIDVPLNVRFSSNRHAVPIYEWELEILLRETLINGCQNCTGPRLLDWNTLCRGINKIKEFENDVSRITNNPGNIKVQLFRIAHRQFAWQQRKPNSSLIARYHAIFSHKEIDSLFQGTYGLYIDELYQIGMVFLGGFCSNPTMGYPIRSEIKQLDSSKIARFLELYSLPVSELVSFLRKEQEFNENFFHSFSSLRRYPLFTMKYDSREVLVCPNISAFMWQITEGLFYLLCHDDSFGNAYGISFQSYVGEVLSSVFASTRFAVFDEQEYGPKKGKRDSVDWIISDGQTAVFVECKTKRLSMPAKLALNDTSDLDAQLEIMADAIVQTYKNIDACIQGRYEHFRDRTIVEFYPLVVTLEEWYPFSDWLREKLTSYVAEKLIDLSLPTTFVEKHPYSICSIDEFEEVVQVCARHNLNAVVGGKASHDEYRNWLFHSYLAHEFPDDLNEIKFLFSDQFEGVFQSLTAE